MLFTLMLLPGFSAIDALPLFYRLIFSLFIYFAAALDAD